LFGMTLGLVIYYNSILMVGTTSLVLNQRKTISYF
jgi:hypothetical protein